MAWCLGLSTVLFALAVVGKPAFGLFFITGTAAETDIIRSRTHQVFFTLHALVLLMKVPNQS